MDHHLKINGKIILNALEYIYIIEKSILHLKKLYISIPDSSNFASEATKMKKQVFIMLYK